MGHRPWGSIHGLLWVLLGALRQEQAMALSPSVLVSSWWSQSWGLVQPQQPSCGGRGRLGVSVVAVE